ncbi:amidohydrolase family protein [Pseudomonadota bacterium]
MTLLVAMAVLVLSGNVMSQSQQIRAGYVIDPGSGTVEEDRLITIHDGRIEKIVPFHKANVSSDYIDLTDSWLMPGLIDSHVHITWNAGEFGKPKYDRVNARESTAFRAIRGLKVAEEFLLAGFTTLREAGNDADYATADVIKAIGKGWFPGPDIQYVGKIISPYGGQLDGLAYRNRGDWGFEYIDADTRDEMTKAVRQNLFFGATAVKLVVDEDARYFFSEGDVRHIVSEARRAGVRVTAHVMGGEPLRQLVLGGVAGIDHGFELDDELLKLMKKHGTFLIGTDFSYENFRAYGESEKQASEHEEKLIKRLRRAHEIGVKLAYGTDIVINLPGKDRVESSFEVLKVWEKAGIPPEVLLQAITSNAAELMGLDESRGYLRPGFRADMVALKSNPLEALGNIRSVHFVMKEGQVVRHDL